MAGCVPPRSPRHPGHQVSGAAAHFVAGDWLGGASWNKRPCVDHAGLWEPGTSAAFPLSVPQTTYGFDLPYLNFQSLAD